MELLKSIFNFSIIKRNLNFKKIEIINFKQVFISLSLLTILFVVFTFFSGKIEENQNLAKNNIVEIQENDEFLDLRKFILKKLRSPYNNYSYNVRSNDTFINVLRQFEIQNSEIEKVIGKLKEKKLTRIYPGREMQIVTKKDEKNLNSLVNLKYKINSALSIEIKKEENDFKIYENIIKLYKKEIVLNNKIKNNLYSAAVEAGIEPNIIIEFARIYGFEIDFQRDLRKDDTFEIYYERLVDNEGVVRDTGKIIYASMNVNNRDISLYAFEEKNEIGYFDVSGKSIVKSLMKTPINGARLSSSFGMRKHPILGFNKLHAGTDFAAPSGTPIMASGSGIVTRARWCGGGGNCVKIKHNSTYETVYAHMKSFARGIKEGKRVQQGQIIGYVGSTGLSTGPHLHYEVHVNKKKVNSQKLKLPSGKILKGEPRKEFELKRIKIDLKLAELKS